MSERSIGTRVYDSLIWATVVAWAYHVGRTSALPRSDGTRDSWLMFATLLALNALIELIDYAVRACYRRAWYRQRQKWTYLYKDEPKP